MEARALTRLAAALLDSGDPVDARTHAAEALALHQRTGHRLGVAQTRLLLAEILARTGEPAEAAERAAALALFAELGASPSI